MEVPAVSYEDMSGKTKPGEPSARIRARACRAHACAAVQFAVAGDKCLCNANMTVVQLRRRCAPLRRQTVM